MASGMGVRGTVGRCYGYFADFKQCQAESRQVLKAKIADGIEDVRYTECIGPHQDYFECLHQTKTARRINLVMEEEKKQSSGETSAGH